MFRFKSQFNAPLKDIFDADLANIKISGKLFTILQLELIGVQKFVNNNMSEIQRIMIRKQKEESADYIFVTLIDVEKVFNLFICFDDKTKEILENALRIKFLGNTAKREGILMRKEIVPKIKEGFVGG
jgi:hypothetical protein